MKSKKIFGITVISALLTFLLLTFGPIKANVLIADQEFFDTQLQSYETWLADTGLSSLITMNSLSIEQGKLFLLLAMPDKHNWIRFSDYISDNYDKSLGKILFDKFLFQTDLEKEQLEIEIEGKDSFVYIYYENDDFVTEIQTKMGPVSDELNIPIEGLKLPKSVHLQTSKMLSEVKQLLKRELEKYFKPYDASLQPTKFKAEYQFKVYDTREEFSVVVSNIVNLVLDEGYFEHIKIKFRFQQDEGVLNIQYDVYGKYAAGLIRAPQESRYDDMEEKYLEQLEDFSNLELKSEINKILSL